MLQWMGGSRRKVTASRKSTQKRQQQYFEQRKRQQQQQEATKVESHNDSPVAYTQQKGNRSLDILSLLDVPKVAEECRPACVSVSTSMMANRAPRAKAFEAVEIKNHQSSMRSPIAVTNEVAAADYVKPTATRTLSSHQGEKASSKDTRKNTSMARNAESKCWRIDSSDQTSILDIIEDDGPTNITEGKPVQEAHVAFSVDGLGDLGTETPKQSPQQPARISCADKTSFSKAAKTLNLRKKMNSMLDELGMETECFLKGAEEPTFDNHLDSFLISEDGLSPLSYSEHELSPVKAGFKNGTKQWEMNSLNEDRDINFWNVGSSFLDGNIAHEKYGLNWKNGDANIMRNVSPAFGSGEPQLLSRSQEHKIGRYNDLDEGDRLFCSLEEPKHSSFMCNYNRQAPCLSPYMGMEDRGDNLTSFREESCSSTAVRGRKVAGMPSERHVRRYDEDLPRQLNSNAKENLHEELQDIMTREKRRAEECNWSRKYQRSNAGYTKSAYISQDMLNERFHVEESWLPESEFPLGNTDTIPGTFIPASWKSRHRSPIRDPFGTTNVQDDPPYNSGCRSGIFEKKTPGEFSPENIPFFQPFCPRQSFKTSFSMGGSYKESAYGVSDDLNIPVQSPNSADVADCFGDTQAAFPVPELSAQGSVTHDVDDKQKSKSENINENSAQSMNTSHESQSTGKETNIKENGTSFCKKNSNHKVIITNSSEEDAEETSPVMIQHEFDVELNTKESQRNIPGLHHQNLKVSVADINCFVTKTVKNDKLKQFEAKTSLIESSCQMTVERYIFQLFCVSQQKAAL